MGKKIVCLVSFVVLLAFSTAQATDYYVSPTGDDGAAGTSPSTAWQTTTKVNNTTFSAGDSVSFEGGETFSGSLYFDESGTSTNPITVGSYGTGRATISSGTSDGLHVYEAGGYEVVDLIFVGSGPLDPDGGSGVKFKSDKSSGSRFDYVRIDNVDISQYHWKGIAFAAGNGVGYNDVEVTNCDVHDNGDYGMPNGPPPDASHNSPLFHASQNSTNEPSMSSISIPLPECGLLPGIPLLS